MKAIKTETIILVRHAKAMDREKSVPKGISEAERPLTEKGVEEFTEQVKKHRKLFTDTDLFTTSPYVRAADTLDLILAGVKCEEAHIETLTALEPEKNPELFAKWLQSRTEKKIVAVSHEPLLSNFLNYFLGAKVDFLKIRKGAVIVLKYQVDEEKFKLVELS